MTQMIKYEDEAFLTITLSEGEQMKQKSLTQMMLTSKNSSAYHSKNFMVMTLKKLLFNKQKKHICIAHKELTKTCKEISGILKSASSLNETDQKVCKSVQRTYRMCQIIGL